MKMMPLIVSNHGSNTTYLALMSELGYPAQVYGPSTKGVVSHCLIIPLTV